MVIAPKKVVTLHYTLTQDSATGDQIESTLGQEPMAFLYGIGGMIPDFEQNIAGKAVGDTFSFGIEAEKAYGTYSEEAVVDVPKTSFQQDGKIPDGVLEVGKVLPMRNEDGQHFEGVVKWVGLDVVKLDFNHPMAGVNLWFEGSIVGIRDAEQVELEHGHVHGPGGHHH